MKNFVFLVCIALCTACNNTESTNDLKSEHATGIVQISYTKTLKFFVDSLYTTKINGENTPVFVLRSKKGDIIYPTYQNYWYAGKLKVGDSLVSSLFSAGGLYWCFENLDTINNQPSH